MFSRLLRIVFMAGSTFLLLVYLFAVQKTFAEVSSRDFFITSEVDYEISANGPSIITHHITIRNAYTEKYATSYILRLHSTSPYDAVAEDEAGSVPVELIAEPDGAFIRVVFSEPVVGEGQERRFKVSYKDRSLVSKTGDVTEVTIPRLLNPDEYSSYSVRVKVPLLFGEPAYITPDPEAQTVLAGTTTYYYDKLQLAKTGATISYGSFQAYSFDLTYRLQNPLAIPSHMEIALPPDTAFQKVFYESINPPPDSMRVDADGNWIALYKLSRRQRADVRVIGIVKVFASPWKKFSLGKEARITNLAPTEFWQADDPAIVALARELRSPREIYDFVVSSLRYDYGRASPNSGRLGALGALENPKMALCTEFTDLFIALSRAAGIPAREINGYAHTESPRLQPLSLVADVLHSWPEYWDDDRQVWVPVDPTWGQTTGGVDYFTKLDMRHVAFVVHGASATLPYPPGSYKLGPDPQKDVFVSLASTPLPEEAKPKIVISQRNNIPFFGITLVASLVNPGPVALYEQQAKIFFDNEEKYTKEIEVLLPYEERTLEFAVPYGLLGSSVPDEAVVLVGGSTQTFVPEKTTAILRDALVLFFVFVIAGSLLLWYIHKKHEKH